MNAASTTRVPQRVRPRDCVILVLTPIAIQTCASPHVYPLANMLFCEQWTRNFELEFVLLRKLAALPPCIPIPEDRKLSRNI
jgi:hypothetical protein